MNHIILSQLKIESRFSLRLDVMSKFAQLKRRYRRFRLYHAYSQPAYLTLLDFMLFAGKIACALLVASFAYALLGRALQPSAAPDTVVADTVNADTANVARSDSQDSESASNKNPELPAQSPGSTSNQLALKQGDERKDADRDTGDDTGNDTVDDADSDTPGVASDTLDTDNDPMDADSADSGTLVADSDTLDADASNVTEGTEVVTPVVSLQSAQIAIPGQLVFDESWIFQQDLGSYTIQYGASAGVPQLTEFAAEFASEPMIVLYKFRRVAEDGTAFGIAGGLYKTVPEALDAIEELTDNQRRYSPWIRSISDLQRLVVRPPVQ